MRALKSIMDKYEYKRDMLRESFISGDLVCRYKNCQANKKKLKSF